MATGYNINRFFWYFILIFAISVCFLCFGTITRADSGNNDNPITAVKHESLLDVLTQTEAAKDKDKTELIKTFGAFSKSDKLETIAYALQENLYPGAIYQMIKNDKELQDMRLSKYLPDYIKKNKDNGLLLFKTVWLIENYFLDPNLVPALLDYAGQSNYGSLSVGPGVGRSGSVQHYFSVIEEISLILFKISKGKIRNVDFSKRVHVESSQREALITQWRAEWPKVHQELLEEERELRKEIRPIAHKEIIDLLVEMQGVIEDQKLLTIERNRIREERTMSFDERIEKSEILNKKTEDVLKIKRGMKRNEKLETVAYAMTEGIYINAIREFVRLDNDLHDKRLVPFIAETIESSTGEKLYTAVYAASVIPDKSLLPFLLGHALDNDYAVSYILEEGQNTVPQVSVFLRAAKTIYKISNGKIGHNMSGTSKEKLYKQKDALIKQWREIYEESMKQEYEKQ